MAAKSKTNGRKKTEGKKKQQKIMKGRKQEDNNDNNNNNNNNNFPAVKSLSTLPDDILVEILSRLPLHTAITTGKLSRRWKHLWTRIVSSLDIHLKSHHSYAEVDKTLSQLKSPVTIHAFTINLDNPTKWDHIDLWFGLISASNSNIQEAKVTSQDSDSISTKTLQLTSLVALELHGTYALNLPKSCTYSMNLPNLKKLKLHLSANNIHSSLLGKLLESCPLLEDLSLKFSCNSSYVYSVEDVMALSCSNLKRFCLAFSGVIYCNVVVYASKLEYLKVHWCYLSNFFFTKTPTMLHKIHISGAMYHDGEEDDNEEDDNRNILNAKIFKVISDNARSLILDSPCKGVKMTLLANLAHLKCTLRCSEDRSKKLLDLLQKCPMLEVLILNFKKPDIGSKMCWEWLSKDCAIPTCMLMRLKKVEMNMCLPLLDRVVFNMVKCLLRVESVLEQLVLNVTCENNVVTEGKKQYELEICNELFEFPRKALFCHVEYDGISIKESDEGRKQQQELQTC